LKVPPADLTTIAWRNRGAATNAARIESLVKDIESIQAKAKA